MVNSFRLLDGMRIAYQEWGAGQAKRIITFHGWLDNSNSFQVLGPYLANHGYHVVALDLIGHGQSSHLPKAADYSSIRSVPYVREVLNKCLRWEGSIVIGHSMGAGIGLMYAGCYPETVQKLVMIEGFGPVSRKPMETMFNLRRATDFSIKSAEKLSRGNPQKLYNTFGDLVTARMETVKRFPGHQFISREAASAIMGRGAKRVVDGKDLDDDYSHIFDEASGPVKARHDLRLTAPSLIYHSNDQIRSYFDGIRSPTLFVRAEFGWPVEGNEMEDDFSARRRILEDKGLLEIAEYKDASHHLHIDPATALPTAERILSFLNADKTTDDH